VGGVQVGVHVGQFGLYGVQELVEWAWTPSWSSCSYTERSMALTAGQDDFGHMLVRFAA
jgi:hypothetical protein